ncbi:hypothetical protein CEXT_724601 [Caerostris extrusa]|uniref:C2H2-type domain-containing protein n=1 Tax=Caerostris extrusa TaxID=172846 RepID=A0AAV4WA24_CAEEX|nr:hypothetical protein CEXT_724601 [Caerostris extrusa]
MSRLFKCPYCNYSSDRKQNLTLHVNGGRLAFEIEAARQAEHNKYIQDGKCLSCMLIYPSSDISLDETGRKFSSNRVSFKVSGLGWAKFSGLHRIEQGWPNPANREAHKEHSCSTRPVPESIDSSPSPTPTPSSTPAAEASSKSVARMSRRLFKCPYCSYSSDWPDRVSRHVRGVHGDAAWSARADDCKEKVIAPSQ